MEKIKSNYICIRDNGEIEYISSYSTQDILHEYGEFASIIRQDLHHIIKRLLDV